MNTPINSMNRRGLMAFDPWPCRWTFSGAYCIIDRNADLQIATWDSPRRMERWLANAVSEKVTERTHWPLSHTNVFTSLALSGWCKFVRLQQDLKRLFYNIMIYSSKTAMLRSTIAYKPYWPSLFMWSIQHPAVTVGHLVAWSQVVRAAHTAGGGFRGTLEH